MTRYASLTRKQAVLILLCLSAAIAWALTIAPKQTLVPEGYDAKNEDTDMALYQHTVERLQAGEDYYSALGGVLRSAHRPTNSVLNWRAPLHLMLVGVWPSLVWSRVILAVLGVLALLLGFTVMTQMEFPFLAVVQALLMLGPLLVCFTAEGIFFAEVWAGTLIVASVGAYALGWRKTAIGLALLAPFFRELALPYVFVCGLLAWREKRPQEAAAFAIGIVAFFAYYAAHLMKVHSLLTPTDVPNPASWVQFGGLAFVLRTSSVGWLMILPPWVTAIYLPVSVLGLAGWTHSIAPRIALTVGGYLVAFSIVGHFVNLYWGELYTPLLSFGAVLGGVSLYDLSRAVLRTKGTLSRDSDPVGMEAPL